MTIVMTNALKNALKAIIAEPYGCPMCDSGKLRNPEKPHFPDCGYAMATAALAAMPESQMTDLSQKAEAILAEIRAGLEGVTPGPWELMTETHYGDRSSTEIIELWGDETTVIVATEVRRAFKDGGHITMEHLRRCSPDALRTIMAYVEALKAERDAAFRANEADRTVVAEALTDIKGEVARRSWLCDGRGSYEWDDEHYRQEFSVALDAIGASAEKLRKVAGDWSFSPKSNEQIAHARIDWETRAKAAEAENSTLREQVGLPKATS